MKSVYLQLSGPDLIGESMDKEHSQWIELNALRHQMRQPTSAFASTAGGHTTGRTEHGDMAIYRDAGDGKRVKYLEIQLKSVLISQISLGVGNRT